MSENIFSIFIALSVILAFCADVSTDIIFILVVFIFAVIKLCYDELLSIKTDLFFTLLLLFIATLPTMTVIASHTLSGFYSPDAPLSVFEVRHYVSINDIHRMTYKGKEKDGPKILIPDGKRISDDVVSVQVVGIVSHPDYSDYAEINQQSLQHYNLGDFLHKWFVAMEGDKTAVIVKIAPGNAPDKAKDDGKDGVYGITTVAILNEEMRDGAIASDASLVHLSKEKLLENRIDKDIQSAVPLKAG